MADDQTAIREAIEQARSELSERLDALSHQLDLRAVAAGTVAEGTKQLKASRTDVTRAAKKARRRAQEALPDASSLDDARAKLGGVTGEAKGKLVDATGKATKSTVKAGRRAKRTTAEATGRAKRTTAEATGRARDTTAKARGQVEQTAGKAKGRARRNGQGAPARKSRKGRFLAGLVAVAAAVVVGKRRAK
jgi:cobalamin biosynthesis Mg chelatase CobN